MSKLLDFEYFNFLNIQVPEYFHILITFEYFHILFER